MPRPVTLVLQRVVVAPLVIVLTVLMWTTLPLWLIGAGILSPFVPGWLRPVRLLWLGVVHLTFESVALVELFGLWIASGFGWRIRSPFFERIHYDIAQLYLVVFFREARRVLRLKIETVGPSPDAYPGEPLLVFCRHAGPGDSFTLMYALMHWYGREPRVVLKETLAWDPALGVLLTRLPSRFISARPAPGRDVEAEVGDLARNLDENDAFVIFPEGGNFTPQRRERAIGRLNKLGMHRMAATRRGDDQRPGAQTRRRAGRTRRGARGRRTPRRAHGPGPRGLHRRRLALAADGQAVADGLVADPARGDPRGPGRPHRVALRVVVPGGPLGRRAPTGGPASRAGPASQQEGREPQLSLICPARRRPATPSGAAGQRQFS